MQPITVAFVMGFLERLNKIPVILLICDLMLLALLGATLPSCPLISSTRKGLRLLQQLISYTFWYPRDLLFCSLVCLLDIFIKTYNWDPLKHGY